MMKDWNVSAVAELLDQCGKIALDGRDSAGLEYKSDRTIVTRADKTIEEFLYDALVCENDGVFMIGEEGIEAHSREYFASALKNTAWIVDPVDGTALYANHLPMWGVSIGYASGGILAEGAILLPETGEILMSCEGKVLYRKNGASGLEPLLYEKKEFSDAAVLSISQRMARNGVFKGVQNIQSIGSCVYPGMTMAKGLYAGGILRAKLWDIAGFLPSLVNLGFRSVNRQGTNLLSLEISPDLYNLDSTSKHAFAAHCHNVIAPDRETCDKILDLCIFPEELPS